MIVVVGVPAWSPSSPPVPAGRACRIALAAAARGARVELVGRTGDDDAGDALLLALAAGRVGHVALLRDPYRPTPLVAPAGGAGATAPPDASGEEDITAALVADEEPGVIGAPDPLPADPARWPVLEPADVSLGLGYLPAYGVVVVTDDASPAVVAVAADGAAFVDGHLVVLVGEQGVVPAGLSGASTVLEAPASDPDGAFADLVAAYAVALDAGADPAAAFDRARGNGWEPQGS